jgi:hypothetical protein
MYLVSSDYLNKKERRKSSRTRVTKKKKKSLYPYDKWIATRAKIDEASVGLKALIKAIADIMKAVLPTTTLTQEVPLPKIEPSADIVPKTGEGETASPGIADDDVADL